MLAARRGDAEIVNLLTSQKSLEESLDPVHVVQYLGESLFTAARSGQAEAVRTLLNNGASSNIIDENGMTPLMLAAKRSGVAIAGQLLDGADIQARTKRGKDRSALCR